MKNKRKEEFARKFEFYEETIRLLENQISNKDILIDTLTKH